MLVRNRIEIFRNVRVKHPPHPFRRALPHCVQGVMGGAARAEPVRAGQEIRLVHRLHQHHDRSLRNLVLERGNAERPQRAVRLRDGVPPDRRRVVASGLDPAQKVQQVGLQVLLVVRRCHAVDACRAILARQPLRLLHPFKVDAAVQSRAHPLGMLPRLCGYPLSFRTRVCGTHGFLQRFPPVVLSL